jgi:hypothetical protein
VLTLIAHRRGLDSGALWADILTHRCAGYVRERLGPSSSRSRATPSSSLPTARRRASCLSGAARWARTTDGVTSSPDAGDARGPVACAPNRARTSTARHHGAPGARADLGWPGETPEQTWSDSWWKFGRSGASRPSLGAVEIRSRPVDPREFGTPVPGSAPQAQTASAPARYPGVTPDRRAVSRPFAAPALRPPSVKLTLYRP